MGTKKYIISISLTITALIIFFLIIRESNLNQTRGAINTFTRLIETGNINELTLTIYYTHPLILSTAMSVNRVIDRGSENKIVVHGYNLNEYIDQLKQLNSSQLRPVRQSSILNARLVYVFETAEDGRFLTIAAGIHDSIFVNDLEVEFNAVFMDIIRPFLNEDALETLAIFFDE